MRGWTSSKAWTWSGVATLGVGCWMASDAVPIASLDKRLEDGMEDDIWTLDELQVAPTPDCQPDIDH